MATEIGNLPTADAIDFSGLEISDAEKKILLSVDKDGWRKVLPEIKSHFAKFGDRLPAEMARQLDALEQRLAV